MPNSDTDDLVDELRELRAGNARIEALLERIVAAFDKLQARAIIPPAGIRNFSLDEPGPTR